MDTQVKNVLTGLFILLCLHTFAQPKNINQYDGDGNRHGIWKKYHEGTRMLRFEGTFNHGKEVGVFKFYEKGNSRYPIAIQTHSPNHDTVAVEFYDKRRNKTSEGKMLNRQRTGEWTYYRKGKNPKVMMTENYLNDKLNGWKTIYFSNGQITEKTMYKDGEKHGESLIYEEDGQLLEQYIYKNGKQHGYSKVYDARGRVTSEGYYKNGLRDGEWMFYTEGNLDSITKYPIKREPIRRSYYDKP